MYSMFIYVYMYIYIYREREREIFHVYKDIDCYAYVYIYILADVPPLVAQTKEVLNAIGIHSDGISDPAATSSAMGVVSRRPQDDVDDGASPAKARRSSLPSASADRSEGAGASNSSIALMVLIMTRQQPGEMTVATLPRQMTRRRRYIINS